MGGGTELYFGLDLGDSSSFVSKFLFHIFPAFLPLSGISSFASSRTPAGSMSEVIWLGIAWDPRSLKSLPSGLSYSTFYGTSLPRLRTTLRHMFYKYNIDFI